MEYSTENAAVVVLHMQNDIAGPDGPFAPFFAAQIAQRNVVGNTKVLIEAAWRAERPVIYVRVAWQQGHPGLVVNNGLMGAVKESGALVDGTPGAAVLDELAPRPDDAVVTHQAMSPFVNGNLEQELRTRGVDTLLLAGVATNVVVDEVARGAANLGFYPVVVEECCAAASPEAHSAVLETLGLLATAVEDLASVVDKLGATTPQAA